MHIFQILFGLVVCLWCFILWKRRKYYLFYLKLKGPLGYPMLGIAFEFLFAKNLFIVLKRNIRKYGTMYYTWIGTYPMLIAADPQVIQEILTSQDCVDRNYGYAAITDSFGPGLISQSNPEWSEHRKLLNPAFSHEILRTFIPTFNYEVKLLLKCLDELYTKGPIHLNGIIPKFTMNLAAQTTMGKKFTSLKRSYDENERGCYENYDGLGSRVMDMMYAPWLMFKTIQKFAPSFANYQKSKDEISSYINNLIQENLDRSAEAEKPADEMENLEEDDGAIYIRKNTKNIFINIAINLMKSGKFTWKNVEGHANQMVFGAFETTACTIVNILYMLALHPQYQEIAFEEVYSVYANRDDFSVEFKDLEKFIYLDIIMKETLRLLPTVPFIGRYTAKDLPLSNGIVVPGGTTFALDIFNMHRSEEIWGPQATSFNPDHFLPENVNEKHPYAFIPFLKGIRNCIGWRYAQMVVKITLVKILRKYQLSTTAKLEDLKFLPEITLNIVDPPPIEFRLREL